MTLPEILSRFPGAHRAGKDWVAKCPAHPDKNPSLSIREADGKILLHCHAGCTVESICKAVGIEIGDLFVEPRTTVRMIAEYDYVDENGKLLYVVERREPKGFRQRRPDGSGGWVWNLDGTRRVLYRLPEVLKARSVLIVEGEKDVETTRKLELIATCNPGGAGKWNNEYSEYLRGKRIAIIADTDEPGRKHAQQIAASLAGKAETLKVLELPGAKDLSEWVARAGKREALLELIASAPEWTPAKSVGDAGGFTLTPLGDLLRRPDLPVDYILEDRLVAGTVSLIVAKPKVGKSTLARNLCLCIARGEDFLGLKTKAGECIYLALEEREEDVRGDFRAMGADGSEPILVHAAMAPAEGILALCDLIRQRRPVLVVVDPLFRLAHIRDEKAYAETYAALGPLIDVSRSVGTHVAVTHHAGKSAKVDAIDSPLGSTAIGGAVSTVFVLKRTEAYRTIQSVQRIGSDMAETVLDFDLNSRRVFLGGSRLDVDRRRCEAAIQLFLTGADSRQTQEQIRDNVDGKTQTIRAALTALAESGRITRTGEGIKGKPFFYECPDSGSQHIPGTREPESRNSSQVPSNLDEMLVPKNSQKMIVVPETDIDVLEL
jgi:putative DNA primase/helicase